MTAIDVGDQVAALLVAVADRHDDLDCRCPDRDTATDPVCAAAAAVAALLLGEWP